ncbi:hypothetical protein [Bacillus cereus]|uniref:hypothetical protein n=1 Tax=Bacillus cereus TaxID=1396 RepID=UPI003D075109
MKKSLTGEEKLACLNQPLDDLYKEMYVKDVEPYIFKDSEKVSDEYFEFLYMFSKLLDVSPHNIMIAGSARTGFSLNPNPQKGRFLKDFTEESDIDLVVVSPDLFHSFWKEFTIASYKVGELKNVQHLGKKLTKGFIDLYHFTDSNEVNKQWEKKTGRFQRELQKKFTLSQDINYRIFNDWQSVELYYKNGIEEAKTLVQKGAWKNEDN